MNLFHHRIYFSFYESIKANSLFGKSLTGQLRIRTLQWMEPITTASRMIYGLCYANFLYEKLENSNYSILYEDSFELIIIICINETKYLEQNLLFTIVMIFNLTCLLVLLFTREFLYKN